MKWCPNAVSTTGTSVLILDYQSFIRHALILNEWHLIS